MRGQPPIVIEPYDPAWPAMFEAERALITPVLAPWALGPIEHIGSTAVLGLPAKPVIDIMAGVRGLAESRPAIEALKPLRYCWSDYSGDVMHWFCKPSDQERTHHLHLVPYESRLWFERLAFRDRLRADAVVRTAYRDLKLKLAAEHRNDREAYTDAKTDFVLATLAERAAP